MKGRVQTMKDNEMINKNAFEALQDFDFIEMCQEELGDMNISFDRIGTPGAGGSTFEVPGENPGETDAVKEFSAVILYHHPMSFFFTEAYNGQKTMPACSTYDGITGTGNPGGACRECPYNQFGSGANGGKACRNKRRVYLLREGELLPMLLSIPTGSLRVFTDYVKRLITRGIKPSTVLTKFSIEKVQSGGPAFAQLKFSIDRKLNPEEIATVLDMAQQVREYAKRTVVEEQPEEMIDPETGEIVQPLS